MVVDWGGDIHMLNKSQDSIELFLSSLLAVREELIYAWTILVHHGEYESWSIAESTSVCICSRELVEKTAGDRWSKFMHYVYHPTGLKEVENCAVTPYIIANAIQQTQILDKAVSLFSSLQILLTARVWQLSSRLALVASGSFTFGLASRISIQNYNRI